MVKKAIGQMAEMAGNEIQCQMAIEKKQRDASKKKTGRENTKRRKEGSQKCKQSKNARRKTQKKKNGREKLMGNNI